MAITAKFVKGDPKWSDYTPAADLAAGEVVILGNGCGVLHSPGKTGEEMGVAVGNGIYEMTLGASLAENAEVDFATASKKVVAAGAGDAYFGKIEPGNGGADTNRRRVRHLQPDTVV